MFLFAPRAEERKNKCLTCALATGIPYPPAHKATGLPAGLMAGFRVGLHRYDMKTALLQSKDRIGIIALGWSENGTTSIKEADLSPLRF
jgi:hypothetical protein